MYQIHQFMPTNFFLYFGTVEILFFFIFFYVFSKTIAFIKPVNRLNLLNWSILYNFLLGKIAYIISLKIKSVIHAGISLKIRS